jgi:hypothetical protein
MSEEDLEVVLSKMLDRRKANGYRTEPSERVVGMPAEQVATHQPPFNDVRDLRSRWERMPTQAWAALNRSDTLLG